MRINSINIIDIFGERGKTLNAKFNEDVTLLYGANGCGKTTLLNILSSVISGKLHQLENYHFSKITLKYDENKELIIIKEEKNSNDLKVFFNGKQYIVNRKNEFDIFEYDNVSLDNDRVCNNISKMFNNIYLPLNRHDNYYVEKDRYNNGFIESDYGVYLENSIKRVKEIVKSYIGDMNVKLGKIDDEFRKKILRAMCSSSTTLDDTSIRKFLSEYDKDDAEEIQKKKDDYKNALKVNGIDDEIEYKKIDEFVQKYISKIEQKKSDIELASMYFQYLKMKEVADYSNEHDNDKVNITMRKSTFIDTINRYYTEKVVNITDNGDLIINKYDQKSNINPNNLSSGEKQLLITFATLYFGLKDETDGIFIVDEPELSLHITWQEKLVHDLLKANEKVQYIFATHSPDIIADYDGKTFKMI